MPEDSAMQILSNSNNKSFNPPLWKIENGFSKKGKSYNKFPTHLSCFKSADFGTLSCYDYKLFTLLELLLVMYYEVTRPVLLIDFIRRSSNLCTKNSKISLRTHTNLKRLSCSSWSSTFVRP